MHIKVSSDLGQDTLVADSQRTSSQKVLSENQTSVSCGPEKF